MVYFMEHPNRSMDDTMNTQVRTVHRWITGCSKSTQIWDNVTWDVMEKHVRTLAMLLFYWCEDGKMVFTEQNTGDLRESFKNLDWRYLT